MTRLLVLVLVLVLTGCGDDEALRAENARLREALAAQQGQRQAELDALARAASVAAACDWLVPTCPASVADPGRRALAAGVSPGPLGLWLVASKLAVLLLPLAAAVGMGGWVWVRWSRAALAEAEAARALLAELDARRARAEADIERLRGVWTTRRAEVEQAQAKLAELRAEEQRLRDAVARLRQMRDGLTGL